MSEGGLFAWKRQVVDTSRGPAGSYAKMALPDVPEGVAWHQNGDTKEWSLVRLSSEQSLKKHQKFRLERTTTWNPRTGREQLTVKMRPVVQGHGNRGTATTKKKTTLDGDEDDDETVATAVDTIATGNEDNDNDNGDFNNLRNDDGELEEDRPLEPILGQDYVVHTVLPSDTFQGLCLRYKIKAVELRRVNRFSGTNLALAPSHLIVPLNGRSLETIRLQETNSAEYKLQLVLAEWPHLPFMERKAYLEMNDWDVDATLAEIARDAAWEDDAKEVEAVQVQLAKQLSVQETKTKEGKVSLETPLLTSITPLEVEDL